MEKIRVLVADDHPAFREGLCRLLEDEEDFEIVAMSADGEEAIRMAKEFVPDVAIIDVAMPVVNGIEATRQIRAACPATSILMVSAYGYESYMLAALREGAAGYVLKDAPLRELVNAVRSVHVGEAAFDLKTLRKILRRLADEKGEERTGLEVLHSRELEVLKLAARAMSNKEIAAELVISERTVQTHMFNIFRKLGVGSRMEAVLRAIKEGWLGHDDLP